MAALPLHVTLSKLAAESREKIAGEVISLTAVRDAASAAALKGLNEASINVGPANLGGTKAMKEAEDAFSGLRFRWVESVDREGARYWELRITWPG